MMPYVEQQALFNAWNFGGDLLYYQGIYDAPFRYAGAVNTTVSATRVNAYMCPSDGGNTSLTGIGRVTSQNYVVNFGNLDTAQQVSFNNVPFLGAPFTDMNGTSTNAGMGGQKVVTFSGIPDGLSNTLLVSECVVGQGSNATAPYDLRGFSWWGSAASFVGWLTPNSTLPDVTESVSYCVYPYQMNPPCIAPTAALPRMNAARSRHPGGVNCTMGDGSVKFMKNTVNRTIWSALSSTKGGEVISSDAY